MSAVTESWQASAEGRLDLSISILPCLHTETPTGTHQLLRIL